MILPILYIDDCGTKGKGVFTYENIAINTVIEIAPVIILSEEDRKIVETTKLNNYIFEWGNDNNLAALGMGYMSMYNHSYNANCIYEMDYDEEKMIVKTVKNILVGEELTINYNATPNDKTPIWFDAE